MNAVQAIQAKMMRFVTGGALLGPEFDELCRVDTRPYAAVPIGSRLGAFEIVAVLALGGWGTVYRGKRVEGGFVQSAALKVFPPLRSRIDSVKRECELLASLSHPLIPRIYDAGVLDSGESWFAMELVVGEQIDAHCQRTSLSIESRIDLLIQICSAVEHAHSLGIIHRDIKPSNILVDATGHPKLLDFGISIRDSDNEDPAPNAAFTVGFASPEQLRGETLTLASDIHQLGQLATTLLHDAKRVKQTIPIALDRLNIDAVIARATAMAPEHRYPIASALAADLRCVRDQKPAELAGLSRLRRTAIVMLRHRVVSVVASVSLVFAITSAVWSINETYVAASKMQAVEANSRWALDFVEGMVRQADPSLNTGDTAKALATLDVAANQLVAAKGLPQGVRLRLARTIVDLYTEINEIDKAVSLGVQMMGSDQTAWRNKDTLLLALSIAKAEAFRRRFAEAREYIDTVRDLGASLPEWAEIEAARLLRSADISISAGHYDLATTELEAAETMVLRLFPDLHPYTYQLRVSQSQATRASATDRREWYASEAVRIAEKLFGNAYRDTFTSRVVLANRMDANPRPDEALALLDVTLGDAARLPLNEKPDSNTPPARLADNVVELAGALLQAGDVAAANAVLDRYGSALASLNSVRSPMLAWRYLTLCKARVGVGRYDEARTYLHDVERLVHDDGTADAKLISAIRDLRLRPR